MTMQIVILDGVVPPREISPREALTSVGRSPDETIFIDDRTVSRRHALIRRHGPALVIEDVGSTFGTFLNDRPLKVGTQARLRDGDVLRFGQVRAICRLYGESDDPKTRLRDASFASQANARALLLEGEIVRRRPIAGSRVLIGSAPYCEIRLTDANAPEEQAAILASDGRFTVEPRCPQHLPLLNERQESVDEPVALPSNSVLLLGSAQLLFLYDFDATGEPTDDPLVHIPRRRLIRYVAAQSGVSRSALRRLTRDRSQLGQNLGELLVESSLVTPLFWRVVCVRLAAKTRSSSIRLTHWLGSWRERGRDEGLQEGES